MSAKENALIGKALDILKDGLIPFVEKRLESRLKGYWQVEVSDRISGVKHLVEQGEIRWDALALLKAMLIFRKQAFSDLGHQTNGFVAKLCGTRNRWAHQSTFTREEAILAIDTMQLLLEEVAKREDSALDFVGRIAALQNELVPATTEETESSGTEGWISYHPKVW